MAARLADAHHRLALTQRAQLAAILRLGDIGGRLKAYRVERGLTADEIAQKLGISRAAVYRIESGEIVKIETLERLAGALSTSLASLLTGRTVRSDVAMTGEISLRGVVMPIGGVKEKCVAAARAGIRTVILRRKHLSGRLFCSHDRRSAT